MGVVCEVGLWGVEPKGRRVWKGYHAFLMA